MRLAQQAAEAGTLSCCSMILVRGSTMLLLQLITIVQHYKLRSTVPVELPATDATRRPSVSLTDGCHHCVYSQYPSCTRCDTVLCI